MGSRREFNPIFAARQSGDYATHFSVTLNLLSTCKESHRVVVQKLPYNVAIQNWDTGNPYGNLRFGNHDNIGIVDITLLTEHKAWWASMQSTEWIGSIKNLYFSQFEREECFLDRFEWEDIIDMFKNARNITVDLRFGTYGLFYTPPDISQWWDKRLEALEALRERNTEGLVIPDVVTKKGKIMNDF